MKKNKTDETPQEKMLEDTECYTYEVTMVVQVLAPSRDVADMQLDAQGGYVSDRSVKFIRSIKIHDSRQEELFSQLEDPS